MNIRKITDEILSSAMVIMWCYGATKKIIKHDRFNAEISWFPLISNVATFISYAFPALLLITSVLITINKTRLLGLYISLGILAILNAYLFSVVRFAEKVPCSCSGIWDNIEWNGQMIINLVFIVINVVAIVNHARMKKAMATFNHGKLSI
jgi:hypothetical protein